MPPGERKSSRDHTTSFKQFLETLTPTWNWDWHYQLLIEDRCEAIAKGQLKRLMLFLPPRHGKSEMVTIRYPVWRLRREPTTRIIVGAYNQFLANKFNRKIRKLADLAKVRLSKERKAAEEWETVEGGGVRAVGVGGGVTGLGGHLLIIDDPVKNREEAESLAVRDRVWDWYTNDMYTRLEPNGAIILIMTRWHDDDLAGRILNSDAGSDWEVIVLPAEAEVNDPLGREIGEPLCPARFDKGALEGIKLVLGRDYYALYQQTPRPREGEMFKLHWFTKVPGVPHDAYMRIRYWDFAASEGRGAYTSGVRVSYYRGIFYIEDVVRGRWESAERNAQIRLTAIKDHSEVGTMTTWIEQEPGASGKEASQALIRELVGFPVYAETVSGDKEVRAEPLASQASVGNVKLVEAPWNQNYLSEIASFPTGRFKDQVDATSGAVNKIAESLIESFVMSYKNDHPIRRWY